MTVDIDKSFSPLQESRGTSIRFTAVIVLLVGFLLSSRDWISVGVIKGEADWQIADWFINYESGFIRRGIGGQLLFLTGLKGQSLVYLVILIQLSLLGLLFSLSLYLFLTKERSRAWLLLLLSPAFLLFPVVDPSGGFRKELIALNAFALLMIALKRKNTKILLVSLLLFIFSILAHEASAVLIPAISVLLLSDSWITKSRIRLSITILSISLATVMFLMAVSNQVDNANIFLICRAWAEVGLEGCSKAGPIVSLGQDSAYTRRVLLNELFPGYWGYLLPMTLSFIPLVNLGLFKRYPLFSWTLVFSFLPLFTVAWDYGRLVFFLIGTLSIFTLAVDKINEFKIEPSWFIVSAYALLWGFSHYGAQSNQFALLPTYLARLHFP